MEPENIKSYLSELQEKVSLFRMLVVGLEEVSASTRNQVLLARKKRSTKDSNSDVLQHLEHAVNAIRFVDQLNEEAALDIARTVPEGMLSLQQYDKEVLTKVRYITAVLNEQKEEILKIYEQYSKNEESYERICAEVEDSATDFETERVSDPNEGETQNEGNEDKQKRVHKRFNDFYMLENALEESSVAINTKRKTLISDTNDWLDQIRAMETRRIELQWDSLSIVGLKLDDIISRRGAIVARGVDDIAKVSAEFEVTEIHTCCSDEAVAGVSSSSAMQVYEYLLVDISQSVNTIDVFDEKLQSINSTLDHISTSNQAAGRVVGDILRGYGFLREGIASPRPTAMWPMTTHKYKFNCKLALFKLESPNLAEAWLSLIKTLTYFADPTEDLWEWAVDNQIFVNEASSPLSPSGGSDVGDFSVNTDKKPPNDLKKDIEHFIDSLDALRRNMEAMKMSLLGPQQKFSENVQRHRDRVSKAKKQISALEAEIHEKKRAIAMNLSSTGDEESLIEGLQREIDEAVVASNRASSSLDDTLSAAIEALWSLVKTHRETLIFHIERTLETLLEFFASERTELAMLVQSLDELRSKVSLQDVESELRTFLSCPGRENYINDRAEDPLTPHLSSIPLEPQFCMSKKVEAMRRRELLPPVPTRWNSAALEPTSDAKSSTERAQRSDSGDSALLSPQVSARAHEHSVLPVGIREIIMSNSSPGHGGPMKKSLKSNVVVDPARISGLGSSPGNMAYDPETAKYVMASPAPCSTNEDGVDSSHSEGGRVRPEEEGKLSFITSRLPSIQLPSKPSFNPRGDPKLLKELGLPDGESIIDWFNCCIFPSVSQSWILKQGTCFITQQFFAFRGWPETSCKRLLHLGQISHIEKQTTVKIIPNAIRIFMLNGDEHFFGSFIDRDQCFNLLQHHVELEKRFVALRAEDSLRKASSKQETLESAKQERAKQAELDDERELKTIKELVERTRSVTANDLSSSGKVAYVDDGVPFDYLLEDCETELLLDRELALSPRQLYEWCFKDAKSGHHSFLASVGDLEITGDEWQPLNSSAAYCEEDSARVPFQASRKLSYAHPRESMLMFGPKNAPASAKQYLYLAGEGSQYHTASLSGTGIGSDSAATLDSPFRGLLFSVTSFEGIPMSSSFRVLQYWQFEASQSHPATHTRVRISFRIFYVSSCMFTSKIEQGTKDELGPVSEKWCNWAEEQKVTRPALTAAPVSATRQAVIPLASAKFAEKVRLSSPVKPATSYLPPLPSEVNFWVIFLVVLLVVLLLSQQLLFHYNLRSIMAQHSELVTALSKNKCIA